MGWGIREVWRQVPKGLLGMVALVGLGERFVSTHDLRFTGQEAQDWKTSADAARSSRQVGGILCLGDSQVKFGLLPLVLEAQTGQPTQSLAVLRGQAPTTYFLLRDAIESGARPSAVVVDWEPNLLRDDGMILNNRLWPEIASLRDAADLAWTTGDSSRLGAVALAGALPSLRARLDIRDNIRGALAGETSPLGERLAMSWRNKMMNRGAMALAKDHVGRHADTKVWGNPMEKPWAADPVNTVYARRTLKLAEEHGIPVVVVLMPVMPELQAKYDLNGHDGPYTAWVRKLVRRSSNARVVDARRSGYNAAVFSDPIHLDREGAEAASLALGTLIRQQIEAPTPVATADRWVALPPRGAEPSRVAFEDTTRTYQIMSRAGLVR